MTTWFKNEHNGDKPAGTMFRRCCGIMLLYLLLLSGTACSKDEVEPSTPTPDPDPVPQQYDVPFANVPDTRDITMYEVNIQAFSQSGDLAGVKGRLSELKALGVNVIWLMPIYPIGELKGVGSPYAVRNYTGVNPAFGNLEDLRALVKEAHALDMAVMLDWVANHTSWDNPWIKNAAWYTQDANGNIIKPAGTNWNDVADLNFSSTAMRKEMIKSMKYWVLEANVDGFRCDHADGVPLDFWKQAIDTLRKIPNREIVMFAEGGKTELYSAGFDLTFGWGFYSKVKEVYNNTAAVSTLYTVNASDNANSPDDKEVLRWITNHDDCAWDNSAVTIFKGQQGAVSAFVVASYTGGVPLIYSGQEVGYAEKLPFFANTSAKINWTTNPEILSAYKKLLAFRNGSVAIKAGTIETYADTDIIAFKRVSASEEVVVLVNPRNSAKEFTLPVSLNNTDWTNALTGEAINLQTVITLNGYEYLVLKK
jgi:alpha-amylase